MTIRGIRIGTEEKIVDYKELSIRRKLLGRYYELNCIIPKDMLKS